LFSQKCNDFPLQKKITRAKPAYRRQDAKTQRTAFDSPLRLYANKKTLSPRQTGITFGSQACLPKAGGSTNLSAGFFCGYLR
jgi:hypothetical protein